jgi:hypothetical protein
MSSYKASNPCSICGGTVKVEPLRETSQGEKSPWKREVKMKRKGVVYEKGRINDECIESVIIRRDKLSKRIRTYKLLERTGKLD